MHKRCAGHVLFSSLCSIAPPLNNTGGIRNALQEFDSAAMTVQLVQYAGRQACVCATCHACILAAAKSLDATAMYIRAGI